MSVLFSRSRTLSVSLSAASLLAGSVLLATPAAAAETAQLSILHALPGLTVDIYVDGTKKVNDLEPGELAGPLAVSPGSHDVAIVKSTAPNGKVPGIDLTAEVTANGNYTAVVYRDGDQKRAAKLYTNDVDATPAGEGRVTVRHVAAADAVDVDIDGTTVVKKIANTAQKSVETASGPVELTVSAAGSAKPIIGPAGLVVADGKTTVVYVWGSTKVGSQTIAVQTVAAGASAPGGVPAGETGEAADRGFAPFGAALAAVALGAVVLVGRARRSSTGVLTRTR